MHFALPSNLQQELLAYDPKLKVLAKKEQPKKNSTKPKYPLGKIPHLIPTNVVRAELQDDAIERINTLSVSNRYHTFTKVVDIATPEARTITTAILYHYEQCWYAGWLPAKGEEDDYVYGCAYAFKDTEATRKVIPSNKWDIKDKCSVQDNGRAANIYYYTHKVTKEDIINGLDARMWRAMGIASYYQKSRSINQAINRFESTLIETISTWEDSRNMFERIKCDNIWNALDLPTHLLNSIEDKTIYPLMVDNFVALAEKLNRNREVYSPLYMNIGDIIHIVTTPYLKKQLQAELDTCIQEYNNPDNTLRKAIKYGYKAFEQIINSIHFVHKVWPDCPLDHYRTYYQELRTISMVHMREDARLVEWLRLHMPVTSFFNILRKFKEDKAPQPTIHYDDYNYPVHHYYELNDTFSMIMRILGNGKTLTPPKRWRMPELHDYVQAEAWKIENPNEKLHQELFPTPVKVDVDGSEWTFLQPMNTHQLAQWGRAVRNCVGSASHYADNIKKRKHFIVLCMIDGNPVFTIQMEVSMGVMNVKQISGVANQRLTDEQREQYSLAFKEALRLRSEQVDCKG